MAKYKCSICGCGMKINETNPQLKSVYMGLTYYFRTPECKCAFDESPVKYAAVC